MRIFVNWYLLSLPNSTFTFTFTFQTLQNLTPTVERDDCASALEPVNQQKSRFKNILPGMLIKKVYLIRTRFGLTKSVLNSQFNSIQKLYLKMVTQ